MITELYIDGKLADLSGSDVIALTKSVFDVNRLAVRTSDYSNVFRIPKTQQNRLIFKSAGIVNSFSDEPYTRLTASIKVDGVEVANGFAQLKGSDGDYFSVNIQSGNGNFFNQIKSLSLTDLESYLTPLNHTYNATEVSARRDSSEVIVYPNVDYGWFERASTGDQPFNYFYPALYAKYIIDSAIDSLGYNQIGDFWTSSVYSRLAIMSKGIVSDADSYYVEYALDSGFNFFITRDTETPTDTYIYLSPLNFPEEKSDNDGLYLDTDLGLGYTTLAYNFPVNFDSETTWQISLNGQANIQNVVAQYRNFLTEEASLVFRLEIWNKDTDTFVNNALEVKYTFYEATYTGAGLESDPYSLLTENFINEFTIDEAINNPSNLNAIGGSATDHCLVWVIGVETFSSIFDEPIATYDSLGDVSVDLDFSLRQITGGSPSEVSVVDSFDDINIGSLFLYACNQSGVFPLVDESIKQIRMVSFDTIRTNKTNALDWSNKLDLTDEPKISFRLDYARNNIFEYSNDTKDVWLNQLTNYGRGVLTVDDENLQQEATKYKSPYSLCAISQTFNNARSMAKIYTGDKYVFNGVDYDLDEEATVEGFSTRIVLLSRSTTNPIQIDGGTVVTANYEVNNQPILFQNVLNNSYSLISGMLEKTKVVQCLLRLTNVDFEQLDFTKPVFIDYFNDYFVVNEISQFKANIPDSTQVTLIRL